jgi:hypothetical protein
MATQVGPPGAPRLIALQIKLKRDDGISGIEQILCEPAQEAAIGAAAAEERSLFRGRNCRGHCGNATANRYDRAKVPDLIR